MKNESRIDQIVARVAASDRSSRYANGHIDDSLSSSIYPDGAIVIILPVTPVPKPRMTQSDRWNSRPCCEQYWAFKDEIRSLVSPADFPHPCHLTFVLPMPRSWSEKRKRENDGQPHTQRPDWDNLAKALTDALFDEDGHLYDVRVTKLWGREGKIILDEMS